MVSCFVTVSKDAIVAVNEAAVPTNTKKETKFGLLVFTHPQRPRGSQSGWERGGDESFQVRAKKPLGTDSH